MATFKWKRFASVSLRLLFFTFFTCSLTATSTQFMADPFEEDMCKMVNCVQGTCQPTPRESPGFQCHCNTGWKKVKVFAWEIPTLCLLPNCTIDFKCENGSLPPPPPPPSPLAFEFPPLNFLDPCLLSLCGDGICERNGTEYKCKCNEGSANLLNNPKLACFKKCSLGGDCNGIDLGLGSPPPPSPPPQGSGSGPDKMPTSCSETFHMLSSIIALATVFLALI